jgi:hypothetical protein
VQRVLEESECLARRPVLLLGEHLGVVATLVDPLLVLGVRHLDQPTAEVLDQKVTSSGG